MKGKVLKPHPNRSCDLLQLPCQNLSSGRAGRLPGEGSGCEENCEQHRGGRHGNRPSSSCVGRGF